jgi:thiol-disulfide isomerase/thioredoxin
MTRRGWGGVLTVTALVAAGAFVASGARETVRAPAARPNPDARPPAIRAVAGVPHVETTDPESLLVADTLPPGRRDAHLLWFEGRPAVAVPDGRLVFDAAGSPVVLDEQFAAWRPPWRLEGREPVSAAPAAEGGYWVALRDGRIVRLAANGRIVDSLATPHAYAWLAAGPRVVWAFRSPIQFSFPFGRPLAPLVTPVAGLAPPPVPARPAAIPFMTDLVNAGRVVPAEDGGFFYAPFIRDEILRFGPDGDTLWVATRGLPHGVAEPSIGLGADGRAELDYAPVNIGLQLGPDGMLYVLTTPGHTVEWVRLDRIDPASGVVRATTALPSALPTLAVDAGGRVYLLDAFRLMTGVAPAEREPLAPFALETLEGGEIRTADHAGRVLLLNFWASWCEPCREEMPELDALRHTFPADRFAFIAVSEDIRAGAARAFIEEFGFTFPVALGRGRMRARYHYFGLPFTVLVDGDGRVVQRWSGYGGAAQMAAIRSLIQAELSRTDAPTPSRGDASAAHHDH